MKKIILLLALFCVTWKEFEVFYIESQDVTYKQESNRVKVFGAMSQVKYFINKTINSTKKTWDWKIYEMVEVKP